MSPSAIAGPARSRRSEVVARAAAGARRLRTLNDWYVQYWLRSVPGVAEVAPYGGFVKQDQIEIDPNALAAFNIPLDMVTTAVRKSNNDVGGRVVEWSGRGYMVRGRGYVKDVSDLEQIALGARRDGTPILVRDVARVHLGPEIRRGVADLDGQGDAAAGIVVIRQGVDTYGVIQNLKQVIRDKVQPALPDGVRFVTTYDRSALIERAIDTLKDKLIEEIVIVSLVCIVFLWHLRSALVAILTLPLSILLSFVAMHLLGIGANLMSLGGIAIAIGAMIDRRSAAPTSPPRSRVASATRSTSATCATIAATSTRSAAR